MTNKQNPNRWKRSPDGEGWYWVVYDGALHMGLLVKKHIGEKLILLELQEDLFDQDDDGNCSAPSGLLWLKLDDPPSPPAAMLAGIAP